MKYINLLYLLLGLTIGSGLNLGLAKLMGFHLVKENQEITSCKLKYQNDQLIIDRAKEVQLDLEDYLYINCKYGSLQ